MLIEFRHHQCASRGRPARPDLNDDFIRPIKFMSQQWKFAMPMNVRSSSSPLIDPIVCTVLLLAPNQDDLSSLDPEARRILQGNLATLAAVAKILQVPVFTHSLAVDQQSPAAAELPPPHSRRMFAQEHGTPWSNKAFVDTLTKENRSTIVLAGLWLEHQILATALHALADAYHVYFLVDATRARAQTAERATHERLIQAGATPIVVSQVIHEWSLEASDPAARDALLALLAPLA